MKRRLKWMKFWMKSRRWMQTGLESNIRELSTGIPQLQTLSSPLDSWPCYRFLLFIPSFAFIVAKMSKVFQGCCWRTCFSAYGWTVDQRVAHELQSISHPESYEDHRFMNHIPDNAGLFFGYNFQECKTWNENLYQKVRKISHIASLKSRSARVISCLGLGTLSFFWFGSFHWVPSQEWDS